MIGSFVHLLPIKEEFAEKLALNILTLTQSLSVLTQSLYHEQQESSVQAISTPEASITKYGST